MCDCGFKYIVHSLNDFLLGTIKISKKRPAQTQHINLDFDEILRKIPSGEMSGIFLWEMAFFDI